MVAVPQRQGEKPTLRFNATAAIATEGTEKRTEERDEIQREETRAGNARLKPSGQNRSVKRCGCSKTSVRAWKFNIDPIFIAIGDGVALERSAKGENGGDDNDDGVIVERRDVRSSDIRLGFKR